MTTCVTVLDETDETLMSHWWNAALTSRSTVAAGVFIAALIVFALQSVAWPLAPGRDFANYLQYYYQLFNPTPPYPVQMLYSMPVAALFWGSLLSYTSSFVTEVVMGILYAASITSMYYFISSWDRRAAFLTAGALLLYQPYGALLHSAGSDSIFAILLALWAALVAWSVQHLSVRVMVFHGIAVVMLVLTKQIAQLFLLFVVFPWIVTNLSLSRRILLSFMFLVTSGVLLLSWSSYNLMRFNDFTITRGSNAVVFFYRMFVNDGLIKPHNGLASRELAVTVEQHLLTQEPYRSYGITLEQFFSSSGQTRMFWDLPTLSDRLWGWDSEYKKLREVALEAIAQHPFAFSVAVLGTIYNHFYLDYVHTQPAQKTFFGPQAVTKPEDSLGLPVPTKGQLIPGSHLEWFASTPDNSINRDWSSLRHPVTTYDNPAVEQAVAQLQSQVFALDVLPTRDGSQVIAAFLNKLSLYYPRMTYWILCGVIGLLVAPRSAPRLLWFMCGLAMILIVVVDLSFTAVRQYRMPFDPFFIALGIAGLWQFLTFLNVQHLVYLSRYAARRLLRNTA